MTAEDTRNVWLSIVGTATGAQDPVDQGDTMKFETEGSFYHEKETSCMTYQETDISGMQGTTTTVKVNDDKVSVIRLGAVNSIMEFEKGKRNIIMYSTPYGDISMGVFTKGVNIDYDERMDPVKVAVDYSIDVEGRPNTTNLLNIEIKERS